MHDVKYALCVTLSLVCKISMEDSILGNNVQSVEFTLFYQ